MSNNKSVFFIIGTTASGKTSLGLSWATKFPNIFEIICVDSVTFYKGFNIGSAKPTNEELLTTKHHLVDFLEPWNRYSISNFIEDAKICINDILSRGKVPLLIGGSALYFYSLLYGISPLPKTDELLREKLVKIYDENNGIKRLFNELTILDPDAANNINKNDKNRIIRALEVCLATGERFSILKNRHRVGGIIKLIESNRLNLKQIIIYPDNINELKNNISIRLNLMMNNGFLEEVRSLYYLSKSKGQTFHALNSVGYKQLIPYFTDNISLESCIENIKKATLRLAKKQMVWFKKWNPAPDIRLKPGEFSNNLINPF